MSTFELAASKFKLTYAIFRAKEDKLSKLIEVMGHERDAKEVLSCEYVVEETEQRYNPNIQELNPARVYSLADIQTMLSMS
ncbi:hypothetical protein FACS189430_05470 [Bacteroidia bacterium]|nr:hypothetical protein FACS189430_05470 [Bacteroidia bacterium]